MKQKRDVIVHMKNRKKIDIRRIQNKDEERDYVFKKKFIRLVDSATSRNNLLDECRGKLESYKKIYIMDHLFEQIFRYFNTAKLKNILMRLSVSK